jgi:Na+-transporting NADH:ubiquinone oxidoreductase subunit NqrB
MNRHRGNRDKQRFNRCATLKYKILHDSFAIGLIYDQIIFQLVYTHENINGAIIVHLQEKTTLPSKIDYCQILRCICMDEI